MLCYRDKSFCIKKDCIHFDTCPDAYNVVQQKQAEKWWSTFDQSKVRKEIPVSIDNNWDCYEPKQ